MSSRALLFFATIVVPAAAAFAADPPKKKPCCLTPKICSLKVECKPREKVCYDYECKQICIPKIRFPWQKCCEQPRCGEVRVVKVFKKHEYEYGLKKVCTWELKDACLCGHEVANDEDGDSESEKESGPGLTPAPEPAPPAEEPEIDVPEPETAPEKGLQLPDVEGAPDSDPPAIDPGDGPRLTPGRPEKTTSRKVHFASGSRFLRMFR